MKTKKNEGIQAVFWLFGPIVFYELCTESAVWFCSFFYTQDVLFITGLGACLAFPVLLFAYRSRKKMLGNQVSNLYQSQHRKAAKIRSCFWRGCLCSALTGAGACLCLNLVLQMLLTPSDGWNETREVIYGGSFFLRFAVTVLLAPAVEELLFRGLIRMELRRYMSPFRAAFLGSALFGLYHGNLSQGLYAFFLGLCLELVCGWSGSVIPALSLHMGANAAALCFTALASALPAALGHQPLFVIGAAAAGACLTTAALYKTKEVFSKL